MDFTQQPSFHEQLESDPQDVFVAKVVFATSLLERGSYYQSEHGSKSCRFLRIKKVMRKNRLSEALSLGHLLQMCRW